MLKYDNNLLMWDLFYLLKFLQAENNIIIVTLYKHQIHKPKSVLIPYLKVFVLI